MLISGSFEAGHGRSNCQTLFGLSKIPSDNHIRDMLDAATPDLLNPMFAEAVELLRQSDGGLDDFRRLDNRLLIALDGTEYHCSKSIIAATARAACAAAARTSPPRRSISTPCWGRAWWRRDTTR